MAEDTTPCAPELTDDAIGAAARMGWFDVEAMMRRAVRDAEAQTDA